MKILGIVFNRRKREHAASAREASMAAFIMRERERAASVGPQEKKRAWWRRMKFWGFSKLGFSETVVGPNGLVF